MDLATLRRSPAPDAKIAGVCGGLASSWAIDPLVVRVAFVVLALGGGVGAVLYAAAWLALPTAGSDRAVLDSAVPGWRRFPPPVIVGALVVACLVTSAVLGGFLPFGLTPSLVLLAVWLFGFHRPRRQAAEQQRRREEGALTTAPRAPFAQETEFTRLAAQWQQRVHHHLDEPAHRQSPGQPPQPVPPGRGPAPADRGVDIRSGQQTTWPSYAGQPGYSMEAFLADPDPAGLYAEPVPAGPTGSTRVATRRRGNRALAWGGVVAAGLAVGLVALLDTFLEVRPVAYPAAALLVVGLALVAGTRWGRPRGFLAIGVILSLMTLGAMAPRSDAYGDAGTRVVANATSEIPPRVERDMGPIDMDLSRVELTEDRRMEVSVDVGEVRVRVPANARVRVDYTVDAGAVDVLDKNHHRGTDIVGTVEDAGPADGPLLTIVAHADLGRVEVVR